MKHLIRYCNIVVILGLWFLCRRACYESQPILAYMYLLGLAVFLLIQVTPLWHLGTRVMGSAWPWMSRLLTWISVLGVAGLVYHYHLQSGPAQDYYLHERISYCLGMLMLLFVNSLLVFVLTLVPWRSLLAGEGWSEVIEFAYGAMKLLLVAPIGMVIVLNMIAVAIDGLDVLIRTNAVLVFGTFVLLLPMLVLQPTLHHIQRRRGVRVLMHIKRALAANQPLVHVLEAASRSEYGRLALRLKMVSVQLQQGLAISDALAMSVPEISPQRIRLLQMSDRLGYLPQAIGRQIDQAFDDHARRANTGGPGWRYLLLNLFIANLMVSMVMIFIVPKFEKIFEDFNTTLPDITVSLMHAARWVGGALPGQVFPGMSWFLLLLVIGLILWYSREKDGPAGKLYQLLAWYIPPFRSIYRPEQMARVSHQLADGLEAALPLEKSLALTLKANKHIVMDGMLRRWHKELDKGNDIATAARRARFPQTFCTMLTGQAQQQSLPQVIRYLADYYGCVAQQRAVWLSAVYAPLMILCIALPVGWICIGLFTPLVKLIQQTAISTGVY